MEEFDIIIAKVPFEDSDDYKWRPVFILSVNGKAIKFLRITTKYDTKSDYIKSKYFEIIDYIEAGLNRQSWIDTFNLSAISVNQQMIFVHKLLEIAIVKGYRKDNPVSALRKLPEKHREMSFYTPEQFKKFLALIEINEFQYKLLYQILMFTGARMGEALALT